MAFQKLDRILAALLALLVALGLAACSMPNEQLIQASPKTVCSPSDLGNPDAGILNGTRFLVEPNEADARKNLLSGLIIHTQSELNKRPVIGRDVPVVEANAAVLTLSDAADLERALDRIRDVISPPFIARAISENQIEIRLNDDELPEFREKLRIQAEQAICNTVNRDGDKGIIIYPHNTHQFVVLIPATAQIERQLYCCGGPSSRLYLTDERFRDPFDPQERIPRGYRYLPVWDSRDARLVRAAAVLSDSQIVTSRVEYLKGNQSAIIVETMLPLSGSFMQVQKGADRNFVVAENDNLFLDMLSIEALDQRTLQITGDFTPDRAQQIAEKLRPNSLPFAADFIEESVMGDPLELDERDT